MRDIEHHSVKKLRGMENKIKILETFNVLKLGEEKYDKKNSFRKSLKKKITIMPN